MDERIRRLERRVASGDYDAEQELRGVLDRFRRAEWESSKEYLLNNPGDLEAWARYMAAAVALDIDPQVGNPYYRALRQDIEIALHDVDNVGRRYARHDSNYNYHDFNGRWATSYISVTHPNHPADKAAYGMTVSLISYGLRMYAKIFRDGTISYWVDDTQLLADRVFGPQKTLNTFTSASELLEFMFQVIENI